jgi:hypothetical protein
MNVRKTEPYRDDNIKVDPVGTGSRVVVWIGLALKRDLSRGLVNAIMNLHFP